jgi:GAF domain-containing protein
MPQGYDRRAMPAVRGDKDARLGQLVEEQAALRRVATLVAHGVSPDEVFSAVSGEVARLFAAEAAIGRFEPDGSGMLVVAATEGVPLASVGSHVAHEDFLSSTAVYRTSRPARIDERALRSASSPIAEALREFDSVCTVAAPIVVEGGLWGVMVVVDLRAPLPPDTEERVGKFTELVGTAIANAESRAELTRLADEQAALRRVATLVARGASPEEVFSAVSNEVGRLLGSGQAAVGRFTADGSASVVVGMSEGYRAVSIGTRTKLEDYLAATAVYRSGRPGRMDQSSYKNASGPTADRFRDIGLVSAVAAPIVVEGKLWGVLSVSDLRERLPDDTEQRLERFGELVAAAIANAESRAELATSEARALDLAGEQAALRRVATLVAEGASAEDLFSAVADEIAGVIGVPVVGMHRYENDGTFTTLGIAGDTTFSPGSRWPVEDEGIAGQILATGSAARKDDYTSMPGPLGPALREDKLVATVGVPIVVEGNIWGFVVAAGRPGVVIPDGTEERLARFTELVATAIANTQARERVAQLADEQASLRRVATLVARGARPDEVFSAVSNEVSRLMGSDQAGVARFEPDGSGMVVVGLSDGVTIVSTGTRWELEDSLALEAVYRTGRPSRNEKRGLENPSGPLSELLASIGIVSTVVAPIVVEDNLWGFIAVAGVDSPLPADAEKRLENFAELVATAIANAESRADLAVSESRARNLAREQVALRRVATLIAQSADADEVLSAVADGVLEVLAAQLVTVCRFEEDEMVVLSSIGIPAFPAGSRWPLDVPSIPSSVRRTGEPVRIEDFTDALGLDALARDGGVRSAVGVPIVVDGVVWGSINVAYTDEGSLPADANEHLARFTDLVATSVSNATMRGELAASRARVIAAADESRRRIERDLHDGAQQQLVTLAVALQRAESKIPIGLDEVRADVSRVADGLTGALNELRDLSRGIHPAILSEGGLSPALKALGRRSEIRVKLDLGFENRLPDQVEVAAYFTVSEALTNASKHSRATRVWVSLREEDGIVCLSVWDDGEGGADPTRGSGLIGLRDRIEALGGTFEIESPAGTGTRIDVTIPVSAPWG